MSNLWKKVMRVLSKSGHDDKKVSEALLKRWAAINRPIKFRGKQKANGEWIYGSPYFEGGRAWIIRKCGDAFSADEVDQETVGQYAGIDYRNSKEIYEGAVVKFRKFNSEYTGTVSFVSGCFIVEWESVVGAYGEKATHSQYLKLCEDIEVMYEHYHQLKGDSKDA